MRHSTPTAMSDRDQRFVDALLSDPKMVIVDAAEKAGFARTTATTHAYAWVSNPDKKPQIYHAIQKAVAERNARTGWNPERVLNEMAELFATNYVDFVEYDEQGCPSFNLAAATPKQQAAIESVEFTEYARADGTVVSKTKIKLPNKLELLKTIGRHVHVGAFSDNATLSGPGGGPIQVEAITRKEGARRLAFLLLEENT